MSAWLVEACLGVLPNERPKTAKLKKDPEATKAKEEFSLKHSHKDPPNPAKRPFPKQPSTVAAKQNKLAWQQCHAAKQKLQCSSKCQAKRLFQGLKDTIPSIPSHRLKLPGPACVTCCSSWLTRCAASLSLVWFSN